MIYFIGEDHGDNPIKIGYTNNVKQRLAQLRTSTHEDIKILATLEGDFSVEKKIHKSLSEYRVNREWFIRDAAFDYMANNRDVEIIEYRCIMKKLSNLIEGLIDVCEKKGSLCDDLLTHLEDQNKHRRSLLTTSVPNNTGSQQLKENNVKKTISKIIQWWTPKWPSLL